jgi:hypothetical protein
VATYWGGLQDTIPHGEGGYHVGAELTEYGIKSNWWEAANRVVELLRDPEKRDAFGRRSVEVVQERYSMQRFGELLDEIFQDAVHAAGGVVEPMRASAFARRYWEACRSHPDNRPPWRRDAAAYECYQQLIRPYTGRPADGVAPDEPLTPEQVLVLVQPVSWNEDGTLAVNDAQFPFDIEVPEELAEMVRTHLDALVDQPVTDVCTLLCDGPFPVLAHEALAWMIRAGIVLRSTPGLDAIDPELVRERALTPLVTIQRVEHPVDVVYVG